MLPSNPRQYHDHRSFLQPERFQKSGWSLVQGGPLLLRSVFKWGYTYNSHINVRSYKGVSLQLFKPYNFSYSTPITGVIQPLQLKLWSLQLELWGYGPWFYNCFFLGPHLLGLEMNDVCKWWFQQIPHPWGSPWWWKKIDKQLCFVRWVFGPKLNMQRYSVFGRALITLPETNIAPENGWLEY